MTSLSALFLLASLLAGPATPKEKLLDLMAEGKTETDLGHYDVAMRALGAIVDAPDAPAALRAEALVRLGAAGRAAGDFEGALKAFERASKAPGLDRETKALLIQALGGALPGAERWAEIWPRVSFAVDRSPAKQPTLAVVWPGVPRAKTYRGKPLTLRHEEGELQDLFRLIADFTGLNVVVNPGVRGRFAARFENEPWDRCLDRILSANGLAYQWEDNVLRIARPEELSPQRHFSGQRIDLDWHTSGGAPGRDLREGLAELAAVGGATVAIDPAVKGSLFLKLNQVRWDQAFDLVVQVNGLDWTRDADVLKVFPGKGSAESR